MCRQSQRGEGKSESIPHVIFQDDTCFTGLRLPRWLNVAIHANIAVLWMMFGSNRLVFIQATIKSLLSFVTFAQVCCVGLGYFEVRPDLKEYENPSD